MPTVARDPMLPDIQPQPDPYKSNLPPGGSPETDREYEKWLKDFVAMANLRWLDYCWGDLPREEILRTYQLSHHLYAWLIGAKFPENSGPNYLHRLRFVGIQFKLRPDEIKAEANRYLVEQIDKHRSENPSR